MEINGTTIHQKRKELGITQKELADVIGVSYQTIQNWESGKTIPKSKSQILGTFLKSEKGELLHTKENLVEERPNYMLQELIEKYLPDLI